MNKWAFLLFGIFYAAGVITGVFIDKDTVFKGKIKVKGRNNIQDITSDIDLNKKQKRRAKRKLK
jgi:hypothetical protein